MYPSRFEVVIYSNDETGTASLIQFVITDPKCHQRVKSPNTTLERICYAPILPIKKEQSLHGLFPYLPRQRRIWK